MDRNETNKNIVIKKKEKQICQECGNYASSFKEINGKKMCINCFKNKSFDLNRNRKSKKNKNKQLIETIASKKQQICPKCNKNTFTLKKINDELMCVKCFEKEYLELKTDLKEEQPKFKRNKSKKFKSKLTKEQIELIRQNIKDYRKSLGKVKILYGGCFR